LNPFVEKPQVVRVAATVFFPVGRVAVFIDVGQLKIIHYNTGGGLS
jgi:hypothetical protein